MKRGTKALVACVGFLALYWYLLQYNSILFGRGVLAGMNLQAEIMQGRYRNQPQIQKAINDLTCCAVNPPYN